jgi:hypothetical protein
MAFGFAFHSALEEYYKTGDIDKAESRFIFDLTEAKIELKLGESVEKEGKIGLNMLRKYFYSQEKPYFKAKEVEYKFQVDLKHPVTGKLLGIPVRGVMDMITMDDFIVDHKTSSGIWTMEKLEEDMQSTFYWLAYESLFGKEPSGFLFNFFIKRVGEPKFDCQAVQRTLAHKIFLIEYAQMVVDKIKEGSFPKKISGHCRYCPHQFLCV